MVRSYETHVLFPVRVLPFIFLVLYLFLLPAPAKGAVSVADLEGTWQVNTLATGPAQPWWQRGTLVVSQTGTFHATLFEMDDSPDELDGTFVISSDGSITFEGFTDHKLQFHLDSGKTVMVGTETWPAGTSVAGTSNLIVMTKQAASYSMTDLAGTWVGNSFASGSGIAWWERATAEVDTLGTVTVTNIDSSGSPGSFTLHFSISSDGVITCDSGCGDTHMRGVMDAGKTVMVITATWAGTTAPGTAEIKVLTKQGSPPSMGDLAGKWHVNHLVSGVDAPQWERDILQIGADGKFTGSTIKSNDTLGSWNGEFKATQGGMTCTTCCNDPDGNCGVAAVDADKTVMVVTVTRSGQNDPESAEIVIFTRETTISNPAAAMLLLQ